MHTRRSDEEEEEEEEEDWFGSASRMGKARDWDDRSAGWRQGGPRRGAGIKYVLEREKWEQQV